MPNGELTSKEVVKYDLLLKEVEYIFKNFAKEYGLTFSHSTYHDYPMIGLSFGKKSKESNKYFLSKAISLTFHEKKGNTAIFNLRVVISNTYNIFKELLTIIPAYDRKFHKTHKRLRWEKNLACLESPIDKEKLKSLLEEAKRILDNFDESVL